MSVYSELLHKKQKTCDYSHIPMVSSPLRYHPKLTLYRLCHVTVSVVRHGVTVHSLINLPILYSPLRERY